MDVVGDLLARDRRSRDVALVTADGRERTYHDLITNAYKAANVLRYLGVRHGATVAIDPTPRFHTTLAFLGAAALGAAVRFDPHAGIEAGDRAVLVAVADEPQTTPKPGTNLVAFGGPPQRPETTHWEQELWSENPGMPPTAVDPNDPLITDQSTAVSHGRLLELARFVVNNYAVDSETRIVLRTDFAEPGAIAAGVVAPLTLGATTVLTVPRTSVSHGETPTESGDVAVTPDQNSPAPEARRIALSTLMG